MDEKTAKLLLEIDGMELSKAGLLSRMESLGIGPEDLPVGASPTQKEAFYAGTLEIMWTYLMPVYGSIERLDGETKLRFALKAEARERLLKKANEKKAVTEAAGPRE